MFLATKVFPCEPYNERNIVTAAEASLRRLQTDRIDLYQLHGPEDWVRPYATPLDEVAGALNRLVDEGKILRVGACNFPVAVLEELSNHVHLFSLQDLYGPLDPGADQDLPNIPSVTKKLQFAADHEIRFLPIALLPEDLLSADPPTRRTFPPEDSDTTSLAISPGSTNTLPHSRSGSPTGQASAAGRFRSWQSHGAYTTRPSRASSSGRNPLGRSGNWRMQRAGC